MRRIEYPAEEVARQLGASQPLASGSLVADFREAQFDPPQISPDAFRFQPDPKVFDTGQSIRVIVDDTPAFTGTIPSGLELRLTGGPPDWKAEARESRSFSPTAYRVHPVAVAPEALR